MDIRSQEKATLDAAETRLRKLVSEIEMKRNVQFELGDCTGSQPALMSEHLQDMLGDAVSQVGTKAKSMASGAGHDASVFALQGIPSAMLFIRNSNGSHNADEAMAISDFGTALEVLVEMVSQPASVWPTRN